MRSPRRLAALVVALALGAASCGGASTTTTAPATTLDENGATTTTSSTAPAENGAIVQEGDLVSVHYVGTLDDGEQFDSSRDRGEPLSFVVGSGQMIPGFDAAVQGMALGETKTVRLDPSEAYGERSDDAVIEVPLSQVPEGTKVGDQLVAGTGQRLVVLAIEGDTVRLDANHPLAGEALTFEIEVVSIGE